METRNFFLHIQSFGILWNRQSTWCLLFFLGLFGSELIDLISEVHDFVTKAKMLILHRGEV